MILPCEYSLKFTSVPYYYFFLIFPSNHYHYYLERIVVSPTWPTTTTTATPAYSGGNGNAPRGTEETSSGGDPFWNNGPRDNLPRHRTESHSRRIFSGSDSENLSYDPFLPSTANPG